MESARKFAERYVEGHDFDPGYVAGFLAGVTWYKQQLKIKKRISSIDQRSCKKIPMRDHVAVNMLDQSS